MMPTADAFLCRTLETANQPMPAVQAAMCVFMTAWMAIEFMAYTRIEGFVTAAPGSALCNSLNRITPKLTLSRCTI